jgi:hypothetical protein
MRKGTNLSDLAPFLLFRVPIMFFLNLIELKQVGVSEFNQLG